MFEIFLPNDGFEPKENTALNNACTGGILKSKHRQLGSNLMHLIQPEGGGYTNKS